MDDRGREQLLQQLSDALENSSLVSEEKLVLVMMLCFQLLSSIEADLINMRVSDGRILSLKLETPSVKH
ncbi:hypothetical protein BB987_14265 [Photorhabdus temperata]|uniref:Uncharacterized protein n=3 Tax=Photorhabdus TaxID=29487 RepID=A0A7X5TL86_9GAMM|nr:MULTISPECIES: hypothetical protein [Photorhabdus]ETS31450.1 hypothetical protein PTE_02136 [Photorhabdus khanii NC19]MQL49876.1 hypothetical protein [Photorhabdus khanii]NHB97756.1 hypothetical protein [Photorhabdus stackebrandtii]OHV52535.1 hypothetical protein BB987_14265 [Photorhabdus temperata]